MPWAAALDGARPANGVSATARRAGVFENAEIHPRTARMARSSHVFHFQAAVLCDDNRLGPRNFRADLGDYILLIQIKTQVQPPFS